MEQEKLIIPRKTYDSVQVLITDLELLNSELEFHTHGYNDPNISYILERMLLCVGSCKKILGNYLLELSNNSSVKIISSNDIIKTFENMVAVWKEIPMSTETKFIKLKAIDRYLPYIQSILNNTEELQESKSLAQAT